MRKSLPREPLFSHVRSWADGIPLGSLDQLQQAAGRSRLLRGDADDPASISLLASREGSLQDTGSKDCQQAQKSERFVPDAQGQRRLDAAEALNVPLPESSLDTVEAPDVPLPESGGRGHYEYGSGTVSAVDSLAQLQTTGHLSWSSRTTWTQPKPLMFLSPSQVALETIGAVQKASQLSTL
jgi:hypothetical protein